MRHPDIRVKPNQIVNGWVLGVSVELRRHPRKKSAFGESRLARTELTVEDSAYG
jgi:hypothetical protein